MACRTGSSTEAAEGQGMLRAETKLVARHRVDLAHRQVDVVGRAEDGAARRTKDQIEAGVARLAGLQDELRIETVARNQTDAPDGLVDSAIAIALIVRTDAGVHHVSQDQGAVHLVLEAHHGGKNSVPSG